MREREILAERINLVKRQIEQAKQKLGITYDIKIIAATKAKTAKTINLLYDCGIRAIGENRVQEFLRKYPDLNKNFETHFIGQLQSNKVKYIIDKVSLIHSLDRVSLAQEIDKRAKQIGKITNALIEVNLGEATKGGVPVAEVLDFYKRMADYPNIRVRGIMSVMPIDASDDKYGQMRKIYDILKARSDDIEYLSMGMSDDYLKAIEHGANMIRLGRVILGERI
ncbi:MAG TPA: YggS family pyridoxal phosphate-dependent enzyme [Clostridiales bacterium]|jgi:pyridoxal phosphate enzyme (YggS family)|nr:YggS family pyridoxal phosphate-dependent enzyme [Clostridiales bacterium]